MYPNLDLPPNMLWSQAFSSIISPLLLSTHSQAASAWTAKCGSACRPLHWLLLPPKTFHHLLFCMVGFLSFRCYFHCRLHGHSTYSRTQHSLPLSIYILRVTLYHHRVLFLAGLFMACLLQQGETAPSHWKSSVTVCQMNTPTKTQGG